MIIGYIGKPRSGKTTALAANVARDYRRKCINKFLHFRLFHTYSVIYSTEYIKGTVHIEPYDIGAFEPPDNALFILGEAGVYFNNRNSKYIPEHCTAFFALHGHYKSTILWDSQTVDVDKKLRNRTHMLYYVTKGLFGRSFLKYIQYGVTVDNDSHDLVEGYSIDKGLIKVIGYIVGRNKILNRKKFYSYFDSYAKPLKFMKKPPKGDNILCTISTPGIFTSIYRSIFRLLKRLCQKLSLLLSRLLIKFSR